MLYTLPDTKATGCIANLRFSSSPATSCLSMSLSHVDARPSLKAAMWSQPEDAGGSEALQRDAAQMSGACRREQRRGCDACRRGQAGDTY